MTESDDQLCIVHLITDLHTGGAEMMLYKLLSGMDRRRFRPVVISLISGGALEGRIRQLGIPVFGLGMRAGRPSLPALVRLVRLLRRERPDLTQTWMYHADLFGLFATALAGPSPLLLWNIRASNMDASHYRRLTAWTRALCARFSARPRAVIVNSEAGQAFHARLGYRPREWILLPNGIDAHLFTPNPDARDAIRQELAVGTNTPLIGLIARHDPMKDHATFLQAAALLGMKRPEVRFLLAGPGVRPENRHLHRLIEATDSPGRIFLLGERRDTPQLTAALDVATLSSAYGEGFPNVVGEAMACGVPCVVTDVGDAASIVGDTGRVVAPKDPHALAAAWDDVLSLPPEERTALGAQARDRIVANFALEQIVARYEALYTALAAPAARRRHRAFSA